MATKKKVVKVRDLKPSKDAKGGGGVGRKQPYGGTNQIRGNTQQTH